jgi:putative membrane protein
MQNLDIALIVILIFYSISDILWGLRIVGLAIPLVRNIILKYLNLKDYLKYKISIHMQEISEIVLLLLLITLIYVQEFFKVPTISFQDSATNIVELISFEIGVFSLYGIYVAFLQFLTENDKAYYLGVSKTKFMLDKSIWSRFTRTKLFHILLLLTVAMPVFINFIHQPYYFEYIWQASSGIVVIIYIYLLKLNISVAYNVFRLNAEGIHKKNQKQDSSPAEIKKIRELRKTSVDEEISISLQREMKELFWKVYKNPDQYVDNFVSVFIENRFLLIDVEERNDFVYSIFHEEYWENYNLAYSIYEYLEELSSKQISDFYNFYRKYCKYKWEFLKKFQDNILSNTWKELIEQDLRVFQSLEKKDDTFEVLQIEKPTSLYLGQSSDYKIKEYLFETLINNKDIELNVIVDELKDELHSIKNSKEEKELQEKNEDFLRFKLKQLFKLYEQGEREFSLPEFKKLYYDFEGSKRNDFYNSMFYSKICFNYLAGGRIEDFSQTKVKADDSEEQEKQKLKAQKIQKLILSMNEEYCLAFMLYQLLYTDGDLWDNNINFYDTHIKKIMDENKKHQDYLFHKAKNILLSTNINHRITKEFLDTIWNTRNDEITTVTWFDQFGDRHRISKFKILYIQWLLTERSALPRNRFEDFKNNEFNNEICVEYFILTDKVTDLFTKDCYNLRKNDLQFMIEYCLIEGDINLQYIVRNLSLTGLFRLEYILKNNPSFNNRVIFDSMGEFKWLFNNSNNILDFYILKLIDSYYFDLYQEKEFIKGFRSKLEKQLNFNLPIEEYVDAISEKICDFEIVSTSNKRAIVSKLIDILNSQNSKVDIRKTRKYRYK